ncbi:MAG: RNA polymerase sigma factor [Planctomycetes bacterium]|nr:RNA polymerase sigma factor [Planctomycetota bacterium]
MDAMMALGMDDGDHELIAAAQKGERSALDAFVRRHDRWVRNVVYATSGDPASVDDIVQRVWATVWQQIGTLVDPARWRGWLYRMAKNAAIDVGLKHARERKSRRAFNEDSPSRGADPAKRLIIAEEHRRVLAAIDALPPIYREPFILRHLEEWSYAQIGEALGLPVDTVETRLVRARRHLRSALKSE